MISNTELSEFLRSWNLMGESRVALEPGNFNPQKKISQYERSKDPYLVFKNVPPSINVEILINHCSRFGGKVLRARQHNQFNMFFVNFATFDDLLKVLKGFKVNTLGMTIELGKTAINQTTMMSPVDENQRDNNIRSWNLMGESRVALEPGNFNPQKKISQYERSKDPYLVFKNVPPSINVEILINHCSRFGGKVLRARQHNQFNMFFVNFAKFDDLLKVLKGFKVNTLGMTIELGKTAINQTTMMSPVDENQRDNNIRMPERTVTFNDQQQSKDESHNYGIFAKPSATYGNAKVGPCEHCSKSFDTVCPRCISFFCSVECQKAEWTRHRYICGKPASMWPAWAKQLAELRNPTEQKSDTEIESPSNVSPSQQNSSQKAALKAQLPPSGNNVILTAISKTNVVFVRSTLYDDNLIFFNTVSRIQEVAQNQEHFQHTPERGDIVLTKFKDNQFNRAMILNPDNLDQIKLIYVDYGNIDSKSLDELYNAPEELCNLPRMAVPIILKNVPEFLMTDEVRKYMYSYLNTDMKIVYDPEDLSNGINLSELFDFTSNESYNETISSFRAGAVDQKKAPVVYREFLEYSPLPTGENVELVVIDSSLLQTGFVSCTTEAYTNEIEKFQKDIQTYVQANETKTTFTPRVNELCIAKYSKDNLWYRGRCIEVVGDGHPTILFFDYGNLSMVSVENIRKYPEELTFPIMTADCEISGLPAKIEDDLKNKLEELLNPGTTIICKSVEYIEEDNIYSINLGDLLSKIIP